MATRDEEKVEAPKAAREAVKDTEPSEDAEVFPVEFLIEAGGSFGCRPADVAGALSAQSKKNLTIEEAKAATNAWLKAPVTTDTPEA